MALQKEIEINNSGVVANYMRVSDVNYHRESDSLSILIEAFVSEEAREAGKQPIHVFQATLKEASKSLLSGSTILEAAYNKLKAMPEFKDAIDV